MSSYPYLTFFKKYKLLHLIFIAFIVRTFFLLTTDNFLEGNATARLEATIRYVKIFDWFPIITWPPLPFWLKGIGGYITGDFVWAPRVICYLFSIATVIPLYKFNSELFGNKIALITAVLYLISPSIGYHSVMTFSEPYYFFFTLLCLLYFFQYMRWKNISYLYFMSTSLGLGMLVSYDMWVMAPLLTIGVGLVSKEKKLILPPLLISLLVAIFIFYVCYIKVGDPFQGILYRSFEGLEYYKLNPTLLSHRIVRIMPAFAFLSFFGLIPVLFKSYTTEDKRILFYRIFTAIIFLLPFYQMMTNTLMDNFRYFLLSEILLLPFFIKLLLRVEKSILKYTPNAITFAIEVFISLNKKIKDCIHKLCTITLRLLAVSILIFLFVKNYQMVHKYRVTQFEEGFKKTALFVKNKIGRSKKIFLDKEPSHNKHGWSQDGWFAYADRVPWHDVTCRVGDDYWPRDVSEETYIEDCIFKNDSRIFVLFNNGIINKFLRENPHYFSSLGFLSKELFEFDGYRVIEIFHKKEQS